MMQIPFMTPEFEDRFSAQAMCRFDVQKPYQPTITTYAPSSSDLFTNQILVVFAHELYATLSYYWIKIFIVCACQWQSSLGIRILCFVRCPSREVISGIVTSATF